MNASRSLSLHESALSPDEYTTYTELFHELVEPPDTVLAVREARGYLKGRYSGLETGTVDKILRLFYPTLAASDTFTQGQFFAVLRLLRHVTSGRAVDPALVFVQPSDNVSTLASTPRAELSNPHSTVTTPGIGSHNSNNPFASRTFSTSHPTNTDTPSSKPFSSPSKPTPNRPVSNSISTSALSSDEGSVPDFITPNHTSRASSSPAAMNMPNPFGVGARANSIPQSMVVPPLNGVVTSNGTVIEGTTTKAVPPALPPRKPNFLPPPRHASQQGSSVAGSSTKNAIATPTKEPPLRPPKPSHISSASTSPFSPAASNSPFSSAVSTTKPTNVPAPKITTTTSSLPGHITSPLIKQGLAAAKGAQRSAELGLDKLRTWEIIKTSSSPNSSTHMGRGASADRDRGGSSERERAASVSSGGGGGTVRIQSTTRHTRNTSNVFGADQSISRSPLPIPGSFPRSNDGDDDDGEEEDGGPFTTPTAPLGLVSTSASGRSSMGLPRRATLTNNTFVKADMDRNNLATAGKSNNFFKSDAEAAHSDDTFSPTVPASFRVSRSKSLHSAVPSISPPVPPPRKKRPESVQIGSSSGTPTAENPGPGPSWFVQGKYVDDSGRRGMTDGDGDSPFGDDSSTAGNDDKGTYRPPLRGRPSVGYGKGSLTNETSSITSGGLGFSSLQRQFHNLQEKTRPGFESARAKVEGKLIPGGYGKWGSEGLTTSDGSGRRRGGMGNTKALGGGRRGSEGSDEFESLEGEDVLDTDDDVRRNGWKPLKG